MFLVVGMMHELWMVEKCKLIPESIFLIFGFDTKSQSLEILFSNWILYDLLK